MDLFGSLIELYCKYLYENEIKYSIYSKNNHYRISVSTKQTLKLISLIYNNPIIYSIRKYNKAKNIIKNYESRKN